MLKIMAAVIMVLLGVSSAHADFTGHAWSTLPSELKISFLGGYIAGFRAGETLGMAKGISNTATALKAFSTTLKGNNDKASNDLKSCGNIVYENASMLLSTALLSNKESQKRPNDYVDEIDDFLQTYPLCKGKDMATVLLPQLMTVWFKIGTDSHSYSDIGTGCSK